MAAGGCCPAPRSPVFRCVFRRVFVLTTCLFFTTTLLFMQQAGHSPGGSLGVPLAAATGRQLQGAASASGGPSDVFADPKPHIRESLPVAAIDASPDKQRLAEAQERLLRQARRDRPPDAAYNLNVTLSDDIPLDRDIVDTRPEACKGRRQHPYQKNTQTGSGAPLPRASVIIPFYDESVSMLLRTVHSVLLRTPDHLLEEVLLVDDNSSHADLGQQLDRYVRLLPKVTLMRNAHREGLIRSRMRGADAAAGPVLVFLDAHTEVNVGWLEPLLEELERRPDTVVQPFIDGIDIKTMEYSRPRKLFRGSFSWDLRYVWMRIPDHLERTVNQDGTPFFAATLVGCAIAVNKSYFYHIGAFDRDQKIWGGENIELAFRVWMCGGGVLTVPCSRVGHAFRPLPYSIDADNQNPWQRNLMRVADTWMGDFKRYFYSSTRIYANRRIEYTFEERESLAERKALRKRLGCRTFEWYLTNVSPEIPMPPRDAIMHGEVTNYHTQACWEVLEDGYLAITYLCYEHKLIPENIFSVTRDGQLLYRDRCVKFLYPSPLLQVVPCPEKPNYEFGKWRLQYKDQQRWAQVKVSLDIKGRRHTWCVMQVTSAVDVHKKHQMPQTADCDEDDMFQFWAFSYRFDYKD